MKRIERRKSVQQLEYIHALRRPSNGPHKNNKNKRSKNPKKQDNGE